MTSSRYTGANNPAAKLDLFVPRESSATPTVIYIHGGGWEGGEKERQNFCPAEVLFPQLGQYTAASRRAT